MLFREASTLTLYDRLRDREWALRISDFHQVASRIWHALGYLVQREGCEVGRVVAVMLARGDPYLWLADVRGKHDYDACRDCPVRVVVPPQLAGLVESGSDGYTRFKVRKHSYYPSEVPHLELMPGEVLSDLGDRGLAGRVARETLLFHERYRARGNLLGYVYALTENPTAPIVIAVTASTGRQPKVKLLDVVRG